MTTDHTDLCKRLREDAARWSDEMVMSSLEREAADAITALREQIIELRENIKALDNSLSEANIKRGDAEADNAALRAQIARAIRLYPQFAECFADAMLAGKEGK